MREVHTIVKTRPVTPMDPALKKMLDDLPLEDPDRAMATVWVPWCEPTCEVPIGVRTDVNFGTWFGPTMRVMDVPFYAEYKGDRARGVMHGYIGASTICAGIDFTMSVLVNL